MAPTQRPTNPSPRPMNRAGDEASPPWAVLTVTVISSLATGAAGHLVPGTAGWVASGVLAVLGGAMALVCIKGPTAHHDVALRKQIRDMEEERKTSGAALLELESLRRQIDLAVSSYRGGRQPLDAVAELGLGPLNGLLEAARDASISGPVVSRIAIDEAELVGADGVPLPEPWPADADNPVAFDPRVRAEALRGVDALISGLESLVRVLSRPIPVTPPPMAGGGVMRTPAQLVDEVVHTAADGIEDLAAGLMRANELASVAERVTNRATLLALNAALEATRSGSEAFAAIAEETRRLAEFAREATDTISRLASEIEYKVGETITAIHSTSEDAKLAVAALSGAPPTTMPASPAHIESVETLLLRARDVRKSLTEASSSRGGGGHSGGRGSSDGGTTPVHRSNRSGGDAGYPAELLRQSDDDSAPMREVPPPIELASDLDPDPIVEPSPRDDAPPEHIMLLERLKPAPGYPS